jgi:uncharacterized membrane protein YhhN
MPRGLLLLATLAAVADLVATAAGWNDARAVTKPLTAIVLALAAVTSRNTPRALAAGLVFATAGDELLLHGGDTAFAAGMAAFVAMHVCYIAAFAKTGSGRGLVERRPWLMMPYGLAAIGMDSVLRRYAGRFALPVTIYSIALAAMACAALNAAGRLANTRAAVLIAGGALVFMASDTLLAFAKFWPGFPLHGIPAELAIVGSYYVAQICIATGVLDPVTSS